MPTVLPKISPCGWPPPAPPPAVQGPVRKLVTISTRRCDSASIVIRQYSAIACSWPSTLQTVTPPGSAGTSIRSSPAATDCSNLRRGASGKSGFQTWLTTISASASAGIRRCVSPISKSTVGSIGSVTLPRIALATSGRAPKLPRNDTFIANPLGGGDQVDEAVAAREAAKVVGDLVPAATHHAAGPARIMRRDDDVGQRVKRMTRAAPVGLGRRRVLPPDIDRGAAEPVLGQRGIKRVLVDDLAARDVDEERAGLHQRQPPRVEQICRFRPQRGADRDRVAARQHLVERGERVDALDLGIRRTRAAVGGDNAAAERRGAARYLAPDAAIADDAERRAAHLAMRDAALHPARRPRAALAELAGNLEEAVMQRQHRHDHKFGDRRLVAERVAHRAAPWQRGHIEQLDPGRHRLDKAKTRRRRVIGHPPVAHQDVGVLRRVGQQRTINRIVENDAVERRRQLVLDAGMGVGGDIAEEQRLHGLTACLARKSSRTVMPRPGRSGTSIIPSLTGNPSSTRSCSSGLAPSEYSTMNPAGEAAATASPAEKAGAPAQRCGASFRLCALAIAEIRIASVMPPQIARSGCMMSTAPSAARSRKSCRVNSLSPAAIGMSLARRTSAQPALSSAVTGSSNQAMSSASTSRQKRFASATDSVPWASHISPISGPSASRAACTRRAEWRGSPSMMPTRIFTAPNPPR